jgi:hypothetical protein
MKSFWKLLGGSVIGTSHERLGENCQDYVHGVVITQGRSSCLIAACADGAGSASHSSLGAKTACLGFIRLASEKIRSGLYVREIKSQQMSDWYARVRGQISLEATVRNLEIRDLACTLLTAIVGEEEAVFSQIGDGAIVYRNDEGGLVTAFWPQTGEYASTTFFLTSPDFWEKLAFHSLCQRIDELALFTDGLQPLALHYASRTVHAQFFEPMFDTLRRVPDTNSLEIPLKEFLNSKPIIDRTDDDKTLMLATRRLLNDDVC